MEVDDKNVKISNLEEMNNILETARYDLTMENSSLKRKIEQDEMGLHFMTEEEMDEAKNSEKCNEMDNLTTIIQSLNEEISSYKNKNEMLQESMEKLENHIKELESINHNLDVTLEEKTIEINVLNANFSVLQEKLQNVPKKLFPSTEADEAESAKLKQQLDEANKKMIKLKLQMKQLQKQIDTFKKTSNVHEDDDTDSHMTQSIDSHMTAQMSSSSNESIEIVEKHEVESYQQRQSSKAEVDESREMLKKMHALTIENEKYQNEIQTLQEECHKLQESNKNLEKEKNSIGSKLDETVNEKITLESNMQVAETLQLTLQNSIDKMQQQMNSSAENSPSRSTAFADKDSFQEVLKSVDNEIQKYNKNQDKNTKLKMSKKLVNQAKNLHQMTSLLLEKYNQNLEECALLEMKIEQLKDDESESEEVKRLKDLLMQAQNSQIEKMDQNELLKEELNKKSLLYEELQLKTKGIEGLIEENVGETMQLLKEELMRKNQELEDIREKFSDFEKTTEELQMKPNDLLEKLKEQEHINECLLYEIEELKDNKLNLTLHDDDNDMEIIELKSKLDTANKEIEILKNLAEEQKDQLISSYQEHENEMLVKIKEIENYSIKAVQMQDEMNRLQSENAKMNQMYCEKLKTECNKLNALMDESELELSNKQDTIDSLNKQIIELYGTMEENSNKIVEKEDEMSYLQQILDSSKDEINSLNEKLNQHKSTMCDLQCQLRQNSQSDDMKIKLENRIKELENINENLDMKNKETLDKCKKLAANLKRKIAQCSEIEQKLMNSTNNTELIEKIEMYEKQNQLLTSQNECIQQDLLTQKQQFDSEIKLLNSQNSELNEQLNNLNNEFQKMIQTSSKLQEEHDECQKAIQQLTDDLSSKNKKMDKCKAVLKEKNSEIQKLQQSAQLHQSAQQQLAQLQELLSQQTSEHQNLMSEYDLCSNENKELKEKLSKLRDNFVSMDETQHQQTIILQKLEDERDNLLDKISLNEKLINEQTTQLERLDEIENENLSLAKKCSSLENELKSSLAATEKKLLEKDAEIDELELELTNQLTKIEDESKVLQENLQSTQDKNTELKDENVSLQESLNSLEQMQSDYEKDMTWLKLQNDNLNQDSIDAQELRMQVAQYEHDLQTLRQQISDMDAIRTQLSQNQTDDQVMIQNETIKLSEMLAEKEAQLLDYQQRNLQLQMSAFSGISPEDPFSSLGQTSLDKMADLEKELQEKTSQMNELMIEKNTIEKEKQEMLENHKISAPVHENVPALSTSKFFEASSESDNTFLESVMEKKTYATETNVPIEMNTMEKQLNEKNNEIDKLNEKIVECENKLQQMYMLQDEMDILNTRNKDLKEEYDQKCVELEHAKVKLLELEHKLITMEENIVTPTTSAFFENEPQSSVFEEIIVPKKSYTYQTDEQVVKECSTSKNLDELVIELESKKAEIERLNKFMSEYKEKCEKCFQYQDELEILKTQNEMMKDELQCKSEKLNAANLQLQQFSDKLEEMHESSASAMLDTGNRVPVVEEIMTPKMAYNIFDDDSWNSQEAMLEEKHQETLESSESFMLNSLKNEMQQKNKYIEELEMAKEREMNELKVKSGKILKKLKDYKAKLDLMETNVFQKSPSVESNDLDYFLQEELKSQIKVLEEKLQESSKLNEKESMEKQSLLKSIDVLTSANEKLIENKEMYDMQTENYLSKMSELTSNMQKMNEWDNNQQPTSNEKLLNYDAQEYGNKIKQLESEIKSIKVDNEELQALYDEELANMKRLEKQKNSEINELIQKIDALSCDSETMKHNLESLSDQNQLKTNENEQLSLQLNEIMQKNSSLLLQMEEMNKNVLMSADSDNENSILELNGELQYKNAEIAHLNQTIEQLKAEDQTQGLVQEMLHKNQEIINLRSKINQLENNAIELENNLSLQLTQQNFNISLESIHELEKLNNELKIEKESMLHELNVLNDQVMKSIAFEDKMNLELDSKNMEIQALKTSLEQIKNQSMSSHETMNETKINELNAYWSNMVDQRCKDMSEKLEQRLEAREIEFAQIEATLLTEMNRLKSNDNQLPENEMIEKMKQALESQEMEMVQLQEQLAISSAEYAKMCAQFDPFATQQTSMVTVEPKLQKNVNTDSEVDSVPRSELEFAMYLAYQRDMSCEELELELSNLLEERDTLQLKLSNALRQNENIKQKAILQQSTADLTGESSDMSKTTTPEKSLQQIVQESGISAASTSDLSSKLLELHSISYEKDKVLQEKRNERLNQMNLIQSDVANLPVEAAAKITGADMSQAQETQSASSVLLNWILGKSSGNSS
uniref:Putative lava lamp n=1 Tax=Corethrella appendiculata TaxID=1370023 RepID=W4VRJ3_9DIPT